MAIWVLSIILLVVFYLLITEKLPIDLTAMGVMVTLMVPGILSPLEAVAGFANPAVITVGAMFLISRAMVRSGVVDFIAQKVISWSRGNAKIAIGLTMLIVAIVSAFIKTSPLELLYLMALSTRLTIACSRRSGLILGDKLFSLSNIRLTSFLFAAGVQTFIALFNTFFKKGTRPRLDLH